MSRAVPACCTCICRPMASAAVSRSFAVVSAIAALVGLTRAVCGERGQPIQLALGPAVFDRDVLALRVAGILEPLAKRPQTIAIAVRRLAVEEPDHRHRGLLRPRRERPRGRCAENSEQCAALHSMTSSALNKTAVGSSRPSDLAVLRLTTSSTLVGC